MGATIRMTKDKRFLIRNTAELNNPHTMKSSDLLKRVKIHEEGLKKDFHFLKTILLNQAGLALFVEVETVLRFLKK